LLDALSDQAALAIERVSLAQDVDRARLEAETERLRAALLTSVSHDLRTPLASILGAATTLNAYGDGLDGSARSELARTIAEEAERLNRFIGNLLDMTRLEAGAIVPQAELVDIGESVGSALERAAAILAGHRVEMDLGADLPLVPLDPVLFEQVLFNVLDNAAKYTPAGSTIRIASRRDGDRVGLTIADEGPGIPPANLERIFDKFYRAQGSDRQRAGTGLGLAICRGFMDAMGGDIRAANRTDRSGAIFTITLPVPAGAATAKLSENVT
jgi:two-component system sensor histidine kinase KdpD